MIGIIVAVTEELEAIKEIMTDVKEKSIFESQFYEGKIGKKSVVLSLCGVGKVNAARMTQIMIDNYSPDFIINSGVAGGISDRVKIGDIVIGQRLVQHDFDLTAFGREKGEISGRVGKFINSNDDLVVKAYITLTNDSQLNGVIGTIASGDIFVTAPDMSKKINSKFEADCCEMEGAAIAQVCFLDSVPFIVVRSISDSPNDNNKIDYEEFVGIASKKVARFVEEFLI